ncbi:hypothetical protein [Algibacter sp. L4_22]|uniref:hypothetical protein n=1 Tax=Algibacter sp. L4_22 TaxID=2942477 RepID=UPI00201B85DD|nr:hypothetical protein [Algibacter sp. L4_22]MCL5128005.1 hypothetical protein [Algibacter sp. L4_22]
MKTHQFIFEKTQAILNNHLVERLTVDTDKYDDGYTETRLTITDTDIWIACDDNEITIGCGFNHRHYYPEFDNLDKVVDDLFNLFTQKKRITKYYKGNTCYKKRTEIEIEASNYKELSTSSTWLFHFGNLQKKKYLMKIN